MWAGVFMSGCRGRSRSLEALVVDGLVCWLCCMVALALCESLGAFELSQIGAIAWSMGSWGPRKQVIVRASLWYDWSVVML